jgi:hypothetical protein
MSAAGAVITTMEMLMHEIIDGADHQLYKKTVELARRETEI